MFWIEKWTEGLEKSYKTIRREKTNISDNWKKYTKHYYNKLITPTFKQ